MAVKNTKKVVLAYSTNTQAEFDKTFMASVIKAMNSLEGYKLREVDIVEAFTLAISFNLEGFDIKGREFAEVALTYDYQTTFTLSQAVSEELKLQFTDKSYRAKAVEVTRRQAIKALKPKPKTKHTHTCYVTELNTAELDVMPIRIMPNIYFGFDNSGNSYEYKREDTYIEALKITKPRKIKVGIVAIRTVVTTGKAQKTDIWKEAQRALITEYNHKVKELFGFQKYCA